MTQEQALAIAKIVSIGSFLSYGFACVFSAHMVTEFERFGLSPYRRITGLLEVAGALGLLAGAFFPPLTMAASGVLSLLMAIGTGVRFYVGDSFLQVVPALLFFLLNTFIFAQTFKAL